MPGIDFAFGVGNYEDFPQTAADPAFTHQQSLTKVEADVTNAINAWVLGDGQDGSEGQFYALTKLAEQPGGTIGWRKMSKRIIVWFGDAPGHDPICTQISGEASDITEATTTSALSKEKITVLAISTTTSAAFYPDGLDDDPQKRGV